jgi:hypothetical protein
MQEKKRLNPRTVSMTTSMEVPVAKGTMEYIAGVRPEETWAAILGEDVDEEQQQALGLKHLNMIKEAEQTEEYREKLQDFMQETVKLFQAITKGDKDVLAPYTGGKKFNFVIGMPRTGGTTVYNALSSAHGWPWEKLLFSMTHNSMPNAMFLQPNPYSEFDMGWRLPWNFNNVLFELCQFLVYAHREAPESQHIFLKSTPLSFGIKLLNYLFANQAQYIVTVRHPGAIALTKNTGEEVKREDHLDVMSMWANLYSSIVRECRPMGNIVMVEYGDKMNKFINDIFEKTKYGSRVEETAFFEYDNYDKEFYESETVQGAFNYVRNSWKLFGMDFPIPEKCI